MADFNAGEAALAGVQLVFRKPLTVLGWGLAYFAILFALVLLIGGAFFASLAPALRNGGQIDPSQVGSMLAGMAGFFLVLLLVVPLIAALFGSAAARSVLEPENSAFGYLRFGGTELTLALVFFVEYLLLMATYLGAVIVVGILAGITKANPIVMVVGICGVVAAIFYMLLRFSLAAPITVAQKRFGLFRSWTLTSGRVGNLFVVGLIVFAIFIALYIVNFIITFAIYGAVGISMFDPARNADVLSHPLSIYTRMGPLAVVSIASGIIFGGLSIAIANVPWAAAYKQIAPAEAQVAQTFA
jgi:hypothetical protein